MKVAGGRSGDLLLVATRRTKAPEVLVGRDTGVISETFHLTAGMSSGKPRSPPASSKCAMDLAFLDAVGRQAWLELLEVKAMPRKPARPSLDLSGKWEV